MKQNKAEKLLAGVLSISLAMGVSVMPAFAAQVQGPPYEDMSRVYLTKNYELANTGTISPEETFTFAIEPGTVTDASEGIEAANYLPSVGDVTYAQGEAGSASKTKQIETDAEKVMKLIDSFDGVLPFTDKASPEVIRRELAMSKNEFKRAVGNLLKNGRIEITEKAIRRI